MHNLIKMKTEWRDALLARTPAESMAHKLAKSGIELKGFINMPKQVAMFCDEAGMAAIVSSLQQHCPQAVSEIESEIRRLQGAST
jgi:hypothetical protein